MQGSGSCITALAAVLLLPSLLGCSIKGAAAQEQTPCQRDFEAVVAGTYPDAMEMLFMATGKSLPTDYGNYDMCEQLAKAHYCLVSFTLGSYVPITNSSGSEFVGFAPGKWGMCLPTNCSSPQDFHDVVSLMLLTFGMQASDVHGFCSDTAIETKFHASTVLTLIFVGLLVTLVLVGTAVEWWMIRLRATKAPRLKGGERVVGGEDDLIVNQDEWAEEVDARERNAPAKVDDDSEAAKPAESAPLLPVAMQAEFWGAEGLRMPHAPGIAVPVLRVVKSVGAAVLAVPLAFSAINNLKRLIAPAPQPELMFLNGIRVWSMLWIILGHTVLFMLNFPGYFNIQNWMDPNYGDVHKWFFQLIPAAEFAVDTFFFLSGFLVVYLTLQAMEKRRAKRRWMPIPIVQHYIHRAWRLMPAIAVVILFFHQVVRYMGNGPEWSGIQDEIRSTCGTNWWSTLLFVNNFYPKKFGDQCMGWLWYMANDMQYHFFTPILFFLMYYHWILEIFAWIGCIIVLCASWLTTALIVNHYHGKNYLLADQSSSDSDHMQNDVYQKPWTRLSPYVVGCMVAMALVKTQQLTKWRVSRRARRMRRLLIDDVSADGGSLGGQGEPSREESGRYTELDDAGLFGAGAEWWRQCCDWVVRVLAYRWPLYAITAITFNFVTWIPQTNYSVHHYNSWNNAENVMYFTFSRFLWSVGLGAMTLALATMPMPAVGRGRGGGMLDALGGTVRQFLAWNGWTPLARLTFGAYLWHPIVIMIVNGNMRREQSYRWIPLAYWTIGHAVVSYFCALMLFLLVEKPAMNIEKMVLGLGKRKPKY